MHTNRRLSDLATKNSQRNAAGKFLSSLPESIKPFFATTEVIYYPELSEIFAPIIHQAIELQKFNKPPKGGAKTLLTSSKEKALMHFYRWTSELPANEYVLVLGGGNGVSFNGATSWVSGLPGYVLQIAEAMEAFRVLSQSGFEEVAIASRNAHHAVVLETSSGFLPDEPSENEVVYELTSW